MRAIFLITVTSLFLSCNKTDDQYIDFVNPFIGTGAHGHTFPGATNPFGMVQLSPDTRIEGWDGCSGYHYTDSIIYGFSHTHLSGTGIGDYCDLLLMPLNGKVCFDNGYKSDSLNNYSSTFKKDNEFSKPGIYQVLLDKYGIKCDLTATERVGIHQYVFSDTVNPAIVLDLEHRDQLLDWEVSLSENNEIIGKRVSSSWAEEQYFYFCIQLSNDFEIIYNKTNEPTKAFIKLKSLSKRKVMVKVGISTVSEENARENLMKEASSWDFYSYVNSAQKKWEKELSKIEVQTKNKKQKEIFYTSLYHTMIAPNLICDINGQYRGTDLKIHESDESVYTVFSLWDTFRSAHPLYNIIQRGKTESFLNTFLKQYQDGGQLPIWELCANYTGCMIGYHVVSVILDAYVKGINFDKYKDLFLAMKEVSNRNSLGLPYYKKNGYISAFEEPESVSKTLEYAYNDWCIYQMAKLLGDTLSMKEYIERAKSYKNIFNANSGFMQPKTNGNWKSGFIPSEVNYNYTEANSWQYSFFVPHDIEGLINQHGGKEVFEKKLDKLFNENSELIGRQQADITGMIGQYAHGNEPSHHMAYLYNMIGKPYKSHQMVNKILNELYTNQPDGVSGNEDCGQMSAWYVLSSIGLYDLNPGDPYYLIQTPIFDEIKINLENGNDFIIKTSGDKSEKAIYIQKVMLNGKELKRNYLSNNEIINGGELIIEKSINPNTNWSSVNYYQTIIDNNYSIIETPNIVSESVTFKDSLLINIECDNCDKIKFKRPYDEKFYTYNGPFYIFKSDSIYAYALKGGKKSKIESARFLEFDNQKLISLQTPYSNQYDAGGNNALIDGLEGPNNYLTGLWQGFYGEDFKAIIDLQETKYIKSFSIGAIQDVRSWIWLPKKVDFYISKDNIDFSLISSITHDISDNTKESTIHKFEKELSFSVKARYVKVEAQNYGPCPSWHLGKGGTSWLFFDEILID